MDMEVCTQISYNGYRADYRITSFNFLLFRAELTAFSGFEQELPPKEINFIHDNGRTIASSDVMVVANDILKRINCNQRLRSL